jgi:predicted metalloenzyme YecM
VRRELTEKPVEDMTEEELWEFADELDRKYEQELRHMARQQGLRLAKARLDHVDERTGTVVYGNPWATESGRYTLVDERTGAVVFGNFVDGRSQSLATLEQVEEYLTSKR